MASNKIQKMSIDEIFAQIGTMIYKHQLIYLVDVDKVIAGLKEQDIVQYLRKNQNIVDKEKLVFIIAMNLNNSIADLGEEIKKFPQNEFGDKKAGMQVLLAKQNYDRYGRAKELLKGSNVELPVFDENDELNRVKRFLTVDEFFGERKNDNELKEHNISAIKTLEATNLMPAVVNFWENEDFAECCYYKGNGQIFALMLESYVQKTFSKKEDIQSGTIQNYINYYQDILEDYAEKIDFEKYMLLLAYRVKDKLESEKVNEDFEEICVGILKFAYNVVENKDLKVRPAIIGSKEKRYSEYSTKQFRKDMLRVVGNRYFSQDEIRELKKDVVEGKMTIAEIEDPRIVDMLNLSQNDIKLLIRKNPANIEEFVKLGKLQKSQIKTSIEEVRDFKFSNGFVDEMYTDEVLDKKELVKMYMRNSMDLAGIVELNEKYDLQDAVSAEELMKYYAQMKEDDEKEKDFNKYGLLFREVKLKGKTPEEQAEIAVGIMDELYKLDSDYEEDLTTLYKSSLLPIRSLIEWNDKQMIYDLIANNSLKPKDTKDLLISGELDLKKTYDVLKKSKLSDEEKMNFIFSSFDGFGQNQEEIEKQNEARNYLIQSMKVSGDLISHESGTGKKRENSHKHGNKYNTDPVYRWQLLSEIDEDYASQVYEDGTVVFTLPNVKNGTVIIEKMYKRSKNSIKMSYGAATYVMSEDEFINNKKNIVQGRKIDRKCLIDLEKKDKAEKLVHTSNWGKSLKKNLDISERSGYSKEKIDRIDERIDRVEKARELVD